MHSKVSRVTQVGCMKAGFTLALASPVEDEEVLPLSFDANIQGTCREVSRMSSMIYGWFEEHLGR